MDARNKPGMMRGKITYKNNFKIENFFIGKLTPRERVNEPKNGVQSIIGDPVYFNLWTPRKFEKAKVILKYKRQIANTYNDQAAQNINPIIELGVLSDKILKVTGLTLWTTMN